MDKEIFVALIQTEELALSLVGVPVKIPNEEWYFGPVQMEDDRWVITLEEREACNNHDTQWVKHLETTLWIGPKEKEVTIPGGN